MTLTKMSDSSRMIYHWSVFRLSGRKFYSWDFGRFGFGRIDFLQLVDSRERLITPMRWFSIFGQRSDQAEKLGRKKQHFGRVGRGGKWFLKPPCLKSVNVKFNGKVNCYLKPPVNFIFYIIMEVNWHLKPQYKF